MMRRPSNALLPAAAAAVTGVIMMTGGADPAQACDASDPYVGSVCITSASYCPKSFVPADGRVLQIGTNAALFSLLSNAFGGDGRTTFAVPDLRGRTVMGVGNWTSSTGGGTIQAERGTKLGADIVTLTADTMPTHTHTATYTPPAVAGGLSATAAWQVNATAATTANGGVAVPTTTKATLSGNGDGTAAGSINLWVAPPTAPSDLQNLSGVSVTTAGNLSGGVVNAVAGQGKPQSMLPPSLVLQYCIATAGLYPPRPNN